MNSAVPEDWLPTQLGSISEHITKGATPTTYGFRWEERGIYFLRSECVKPYRLSSTGAAFISDAAHEAMKRSVIKEGDVLISITGYIGATCIFPKGLGEANINQHIARIRVESEDMAKFIMYYLNFEPMQREFQLIQTGQAYPQLSLKQLHDTLIPLPPKSETRKIVSILTSVDEVIEKTESQIAKLQDLRKGMMQELLTKGIGHTEFKDSPVGRIPVGWSYSQIKDTEVAVIDGDRGKEYPKEADFSSSGHCLFLSAKNVTKKGFRFNDCSFISRERDEKLRKGKLVRDDIIVTTRGTVGNIAHYSDAVSYENIRINSGMAIVRNNDGEIRTKYLYDIFRSHVIGNQVLLMTYGGAQPQLSISVINDFFIPIPPSSEQLEISRYLGAMDSRISVCEQRNTHQKSLKKALMQDLLTGKVRVKTD